MFAVKNIIVLLAKHESGEARCLVTALITIMVFLTDGFLVCNDTDPNRFQFRWTQGANSLFLNKDARAFPDLYMAEPVGFLFKFTVDSFKLNTVFY